MAQPLLIIVNGIPATGKTTTSHKLAADLDMACVSKDEIKEFLADRLSVRTLDDSRRIGALSFQMLFLLMESTLSHGEDIIVECPFYYEKDQPKVQQILANTNARCIEVYCITDPEVRKERFLNRANSSERHPSHMDTHPGRVIPDETEEEIVAKYAPLELGPVITLDNTEFTEAAYKHMLKAVHNAIQYEGDASKGE